MNVGDDIPPQRPPLFRDQDHDDCNNHGDDDLRRLSPSPPSWRLSPIRLSRDVSDPSVDLSTISGSSHKQLGGRTRTTGNGDIPCIGKSGNALLPSYSKLKERQQVSNNGRKGRLYRGQEPPIVDSDLDLLVRGMDPPMTPIDTKNAFQRSSPSIMDSMEDKPRQRNDTASTTDAFLSPMSKQSHVDDRCLEEELQDPALSRRNTYPRHRRLNTAESVVRAVHRGSQIAAMEQAEDQTITTTMERSHDDPLTDLSSSFSISHELWSSNTTLVVDLEDDDGIDKPAMCPERQKTAGSVSPQPKRRAPRNFVTKQGRQLTPDRPLSMPKRQTTCESFPSLDSDSGHPKTPASKNNNNSGNRSSLPPLSKHSPVKKTFHSSSSHHKLAQKKRSTLPPQRPHRRKPSLHVDEDELALLNASYPSVFHEKDEPNPLMTATDKKHMSCPVLDYQPEVIQSWLRMNHDPVAAACPPVTIAPQGKARSGHQVKNAMDDKPGKVKPPTGPVTNGQENHVVPHGVTKPGLHRLVTPPVTSTSTHNDPPVVVRRIKPLMTLLDLPVVSPPRTPLTNNTNANGITDIFLPQLSPRREVHDLTTSELSIDRTFISLPELPITSNEMDGSIEIIWQPSSFPNSI